MSTATHGRRRSRPPTLQGAFDPKHNALNAIRLAMALLVIVWHSFPLTGTAIGFEPLRQIFSRFAVDVFFTISGFLITSSWARRPEVVAYLRARILRIFPAFWVCLIVTAFVAAPLSLAIAHRATPHGFFDAQVAYFFHNFLLSLGRPGVAGTPFGVPYHGQWNGALWTLMWEFMCYLGVMALGLTRLLRLRLTLPIVYLLMTAGVAVTTYGPIHNYWLSNGSRFGIMFVGGALVWQYRDRIRLRRPLMILAGCVIVASSFLADYGLIAALPIAYLALSTGALLKHPRLTLTNDFSYGVYIFGFPTQQLLSVAGAVALPVPLYALLAIVVTLPIAALSWFGIERPALRFKGKRRVVVGSSPAVVETVALPSEGATPDPRSTVV